MLALVAMLLIAFAVWLSARTFQPFHGDASGLVRVSVPAGAGVGEIGDLLAERGIVDSGTFFSLNATITGRRDGLRSGDYTLQRGMSYGAALQALEKGPKAVVLQTFEIVLPEGLTRRELAPRVARAGLGRDYLKASSTPAVLRRARRLGLPRDRDTVEGFLFPATYELVKGASASDLVDKQLDAFRDNFAGVSLDRAKARNLTRYDVVIIASMIEREVQVDRERPLVAAVIHNRLREGMPLGIDATIRYVENYWGPPLKVSQLERDTPYNTRLHRGLPPTPVGNPGLASLEAAADPARVPYLYYVVKPCGNGRHAFSSTDAEAARDRAAYDAARAARGGRSPANC